MTGGFTADPDTLRDQAGQFATHADDVSGVHGQLSGALADAGTCWGDDEVGRSFAAGHVQPASDTLDQLGQLPGRLTDVGDRFTATADAYQQADEANARALSPDN
ncbi:MAG TPA: hypothetical protein VHW44_05500 [Pseudonocardiaceae bacterium]|jgi:hypothetical protein|nr:hypothetical protein [Pseudonocardiaceae bacterium]